jgi:hypothetical protein
VRDIAWNAFGSYVRQFELVVSGRYHALIFSAMAGVPAIALRSNTFKIEGLLELLGGAILLARNANDLRDILTARSLPPVMDRAVIRRCQALAGENVPARTATRPSSPRVAVIEGLDWVGAADLAATLVSLRRDGPEAFHTTIDTQPTPVTVDSFLPVRPLRAWLELLGQAGFVADAESDRHGGRSVLRLRKNPRVEPSRERLDSLLGIAPHSTLATSGRSAVESSHVLFLVNDVADFERLRARTERRPSHSFSVVVISQARVASSVLAWCRGRAIRLHRARTVEDLDWSAFPGGTTLEAPTCAFAVVARRRGWLTIDPIHGDGPIRVALFGASSCGRAAAARLRGAPDIQLQCFVDNSPETWQRSLDGLLVLSPDVLFALDVVDVIAVTSMHAAAIARQVSDAGCAHKLLIGTAELECLTPLPSDPGRPVPGFGDALST